MMKMSVLHSENISCVINVFLNLSVVSRGIYAISSSNLFNKKKLFSGIEFVLWNQSGRFLPEEYAEWREIRNDSREDFLRRDEREREKEDNAFSSSRFVSTMVLILPHYRVVAADCTSRWFFIAGASFKIP